MRTPSRSAGFTRGTTMSDENMEDEVRKSGSRDVYVRPYSWKE